MGVTVAAGVVDLAVAEAVEVSADLAGGGQVVEGQAEAFNS